MGSSGKLEQPQQASSTIFSSEADNLGENIL